MIISQTPLRISLAGGGVDFPEFYKREDGFVVSSAIDKYVFVIATRRYDDKIYVNYSQKEIVDNVSQVKHELVRSAMEITGVKQGIEITLLSDVPSQGSGLGSSSSFAVGLLNVLYHYQGIQVSAKRLAEEACKIEIEVCGKPIGKQDQYIAAYGGVQSFKFLKSGEVEVEPLSLPRKCLRDLSDRLFLFYTNLTRSSNIILSEQNKRTDSNMDQLKVIKSLAVDVDQALRRGDLDVVGKVLRENWAIKKTLATSISNPKIDDMHTLAMSAGAMGAKISGAGGGGFLLVYCPASARESLLKIMEDYREMPFSIEPFGSKIILNYSRAEW
ncbi:MAG: GHMP kinase [Nitrospinae bacterium CG11_big_fil_rev_8_21_14_0_20_45_15]|nr:MAG: GHMP kinase [Nitrospinae bacterium CG11_big_fil_rev_8_21_14_0_20_45_15]